MQPTHFSTPILETIIVRGVLFLVLFLLFIFWRKTKAKMPYQAWALFACTINFALFIDAFSSATILTSRARLLCFVLLSLNSLITIWKSWKWANQYLPKNKIKKMKKNGQFGGDVILKTFFAKILALGFTLFKGGQLDEKRYKIKRHIAQKAL